MAGTFVVALPLFFFAFFKEGSIGGADIRLMFGLGLLVGMSSILRIFVFSTVFAVTVTIIAGLIRNQKLTCAIKVPYAPFVLTGFTVETILRLIA